MYTFLFGIPAVLLSFFFPNSNIVPWFGKFWTFSFLRTAGVRLCVSGRENFNKKNVCIYIANHQSYFDVFALVNVLPLRTRVIAKRSLFWVPVFGWSIYLAGYIPVYRKTREGLIKGFEDVAKKIRKGVPVLFFAEGARSPDGRLQDLKKGAFLIALKAGVPIIPVTVSGGHKILPPGTSKIRSGRLHVVIGRPIPTEGLSISNLDGLIASVRNVITGNLQSLQHEEH